MCSDVSQNTKLVGRAGIEPTTNGLKVRNMGFYGILLILNNTRKLLFLLCFSFNSIE